MFTVKFLRVVRGSDEIWHSISCPHYEVSKGRGRPVTVAVYRGFTTENGVEFRQGDTFDACFIENDAGKTIEHIKPPVSERPA